MNESSHPHEACPPPRPAPRRLQGRWRLGGAVPGSARQKNAQFLFIPAVNPYTPACVGESVHSKRPARSRQQRFGVKEWEFLWA